MQPNGFCSLCGLNILHTDGKADEWLQGPLARSHAARWPRTTLIVKGPSTHRKLEARQPPRDALPVTARSTLRRRARRLSRGRHSQPRHPHAGARPRGRQGCCKRAPTPDPSLRPSQGTIHALPLPERHSFGFPVIAVSSKRRSSLQNLHIKCLHSTLLWGFRVHTETGAARDGACEGNPPPPPPATPAGTGSTSHLCRLLRACQAVPPARATSPVAERGWGPQATPKAPRPPAQPEGTGPAAGTGRTRGLRGAPPLGVKPSNVSACGLLVHKAK